MTAVDRRVRTLRVRASSDERARHAAVLLEDALRTATIAGTSGARIVLVRRLDVGTLPGMVAATPIMLAVEAALRQLATAAVHGDAAFAAKAPAVYFRDEADALVAFARRLARGRVSPEWFWPLVVRGWSSAQSPERAAALVLDRAFASTAGVSTAAHVVAALAANDAIALLLTPLTEHRGVALLAASGWGGMNDAALRSPTPPALVPQMPAQTRELISQWMERWGGPADPRAAWLAAMLLVADRPARATSRALPEIVHALLSSLVVRRPTSTEHAATIRNSTEGSKDETPGDASIAFAEKWWDRQRTSGVNSVSGGAPQPRTSRGDSRPPSPLAPEFSDLGFHDHHADFPLRTAHAGLLVLVPLLSRIGIAELLAERTDLAERDWPDGLLLRLAYRLGVPPDDPVVAWLQPGGLAVAPANRAVTAAWIRATRARSRRDTGRSLATITRRSGAIAVTKTHIDVLFRHTEIDVAVRRAGLDIDPGWVPWLGKVVQFHYVDALPDAVR